jgi:hypothetical protein
LILPALFGVGTGVPVLVVAALIGGGSQAVGGLVQRAASIDV